MIQVDIAPPRRRRVIHRPAVDVRAATAKSLQFGGRIVLDPKHPERTGLMAEWDVAGGCEDPWELEQQGDGHTLVPWRVGPLQWQPKRSLYLLVACRKCAACLRARRTLWGRRAAEEWRTAARSWLVSLTFKPEVEFLNLARTRQRLDRNGIDLASLPPMEQFRERLRETGPLVSKAIRSLRKGNKKLGFGPQFIRYMLVAEPHISGVPHYHLIVHEVSDLQPVRKRVLKAFWPHGFVDATLVDDRGAAFYAAKYLGKYSVARVRASKYYGLQSETQGESQSF